MTKSPVMDSYLDPAEIETLKGKLAALMDPDKDQVRYYALCPKDKAGILIDGDGEVIKEYDFLLV